MIHARLAIARDQKTGRRSADPSNLPRLYLFETLGMAHSRALDKYVPQPYDGNVVLFRASKQLRGQESGEYLGWEPFSTAMSKSARSRATSRTSCWSLTCDR